MGLKTFCSNGCKRSGRYEGLCHVCAGVTEKPNGKPYNAAVDCSFQDCERPTYAKGVCRNHYTLVFPTKKREPKPAPKPGRLARKCPFPDCEGFSYTAPFCREHVKHWYAFPVEPTEYLKLRLIKNCQSCGDDTQKLVFDHDHDCCPGKKTCGNCVRGVICQDCNVALGYLRNDPRRAEQLAVYAYSIRK